MTKSSKRNTISRTLYYFWQEIVKYKRYSLGMLLVTPMVIIIRDVLGTYIFADMVGKISAGIEQDQIASTLLPEASFYIVTFIISNMLLEKLRIYWCWKMELLSMYDLGSKAFNAVSSQSMQFHSERFSGSLVSQTNKFVGAFERFIDEILWNLLPIISFMVTVVVIMWPLAPWFTVVMVVLVLIYTLISGLTFRKISKLNEYEASAQNKQTGQLADAITNILSVKSYAKESHERHRFANFQNASLHAGTDLMHATIKRDLMFSGVIIGMDVLLVSFLMGGPVWFGLSISTLILIINYSQKLLANLYDINHIFKDFNRIFGDAHDMTLILDQENSVVDEPGAEELEIKKGAVIFNNITFKHKDANAIIFKDFSLDINSGERIGLVGMSGSGKTTLTKLLLRFADINAGEILVDGQNIQKVTQKSLRENIAYVPQETALFHRSIADNIAYAKPDASFEEIKKAAKLANADEFIKDLPDGYDTLVGERGVKLSGGQRQRIAIARAILKDAPILVLDEATSALDSESEALIQDAMNKLMKGRTSIVIAHRLSTVANLDKIVVLEDGEIAEQGEHEILLKKNGAYAKLWSRQSGAFLNKE